MNRETASVSENAGELGQVMAWKVSVTQTNSWLWVRVMEDSHEKEKEESMRGDHAGVFNLLVSLGRK